MGALQELVHTLGATHKRSYFEYVEPAMKKLYTGMIVTSLGRDDVLHFEFTIPEGKYASFLERMNAYETRLPGKIRERLLWTPADYLHTKPAGVDDVAVEFERKYKIPSKEESLLYVGARDHLTAKAEGRSLELYGSSAFEGLLETLACDHGFQWCELSLDLKNIERIKASGVFAQQKYAAWFNTYIAEMMRQQNPAYQERIAVSVPSVQWPRVVEALGRMPHVSSYGKSYGLILPPRLPRRADDLCAIITRLQQEPSLEHNPVTLADAKSMLSEKLAGVAACFDNHYVEEEWTAQWVALFGEYLQKPIDALVPGRSNLHMPVAHIELEGGAFVTSYAKDDSFDAHVAQQKKELALFQEVFSQDPEGVAMIYRKHFLRSAPEIHIQTTQTRNAGKPRPARATCNWAEWNSGANHCRLNSYYNQLNLRVACKNPSLLPLQDELCSELGITFNLNPA